MDLTERLERLKRLDTACLCDARKSLRVMDPVIRPLSRGLKMAGKARPVSCREDFLPVLKALEEARESEVLVVDAGGSKTAFAGELFAAEARRKGLAGIVIDGGCRDVKSIREMGFPFYARHIMPMAGLAFQILEAERKVYCGGVEVHAGDIVFGDDDGLCVMSKQEVDEVLELAEAIQGNEEEALKKILDGQSLLNLVNFSEHYENILNSRESALRFLV